MRLNPILVVALAALLLAAAAHGYNLQQGQCVSELKYWGSWMWTLLSSGSHSTLWNFYFTGVGTVQLIIRADVSSNTTVRLAILNNYRQEIWATRPSTRIAGTYIVDLKAPGSYQLMIENPSSATARFTTFSINTTMCGEPAVRSWLWWHIWPWYTPLNNTFILAVPTGIASYGVMEVDGRYFAYNLTTDAVKGVVYIPPDISASGYWWRNGTHRYYGQAFSVRLGAFVVARLKDGAVQYYRIQNVVGFDEHHKGLKVWNNIWNETTYHHGHLDKSAVKGNGTVLEGYQYVMPNSIPLGRVELEMRTRVDNGKIIVEFYANGQKYDTVTVRPRVPAASAYIVIAPATTPAGTLLDVELVFREYNWTISFAVLKAGWIDLELYVRMNGAWVPPPSAWSAVQFGLSHARVVPQDVGSALVVPGEPNWRQQLWAGTIIATPFGINITTSTDLSPYARSPIDLGNGTRLVLTGVYVNGRPAQTLSNVPLGSLVVLQYERQYFVSISAPGNYTAGWFDEGSTIVVDMPPVVDLGNGIRLVNPLVNGTRPPLVVEVDRPMSFVETYTKQYLVTYSGPTWLNRTWIDAGASYTPPASTISTNGVTFVPAYLTIDGRRVPLAPLAVESPLNKCTTTPTPKSRRHSPGSQPYTPRPRSRAEGRRTPPRAYSLRLELIDAPSDKCSISKREVPLAIPIAILIIVALIIALIRRR